MELMLIVMEIVLTLEVEIDLIIYLGDIVEIINVKISLGVMRILMEMNVRIGI